MKYLNLKISTFILSLLCWSCSDENNPQTDQSSAVFVQSTLNVSYAAGEVTALIEVEATPWKIVMDTNNGIITNISPGSADSQSNTKEFVRVKLSYTQNETGDARSQELFLVNESTGERSKLTLTQATKYSSVSLTINKSVKYQPVVGFGGMYNPKIWLSNDNLITDSEITKMYAPDQLGYNILRLMVYPNEADWAADVQGAKLAQQHGAIIFASPWDCTDALSDKVTVNGKEMKHLKHENYQAYANHLVKYINYMQDNGVNLYAMSVQNEPDMEFTYWYPDEVVDFVKRYGDQIRETGVKLMTPEACGTQPEYTDPILNDAVAFGKTDIIAGHLYQGFIKTEESSYVKNRHDYICGLYDKKLATAGKTWWMTEHLFNDGEKESNPSLWKFQQWSYNMETLAQEIHMCMEGYCSAYVYWYLKRFYGMMGDNDNRSLVALGEISKNGYILSHYAKYASDMTRVKITTSNTSVKATAYINSDESEVTIVLLNMRNEDFNVSFPVAATNISGVVTTEEKNMVALTTHAGGDGKNTSVIIPANCIMSLRMKLN